MQQENKLKLCSECKHSTVALHSLSGTYKATCLKTPKICVKRDYIYHGEVYEHMPCERTRHESEQCGHFGLWFEQKEDEPKKTFWVKIKEWIAEPGIGGI